MNRGLERVVFPAAAAVAAISGTLAVTKYRELSVSPETQTTLIPLKSAADEIGHDALDAYKRHLKHVRFSKHGVLGQTISIETSRGDIYVGFKNIEDPDEGVTSLEVKLNRGKPFDSEAYADVVWINQDNTGISRTWEAMGAFTLRMADADDASYVYAEASRRSPDERNVMIITWRATEMADEIIDSLQK